MPATRQTVEPLIPQLLFSEFKQRAMTAFAAGDYEGALEAYNDEQDEWAKHDSYKP